MKQASGSKEERGCVGLIISDVARPNGLKLCVLIGGMGENVLVRVRGGMIHES